MTETFSPEILATHGPFRPMSENMLQSYANNIVRCPLTDVVKLHLQEQWQYMRLAEGYSRIEDRDSTDYLRKLAFGIMDRLESDSDNNF